MKLIKISYLYKKNRFVCSQDNPEPKNEFGFTPIRLENLSPSGKILVGLNYVRHLNKKIHIATSFEALFTKRENPIEGSTYPNYYKSDKKNYRLYIGCRYIINNKSKGKVKMYTGTNLFFTLGHDKSLFYNNYPTSLSLNATANTEHKSVGLQQVFGVVANLNKHINLSAELSGHVAKVHYQSNSGNESSPNISTRIEFPILRLKIGFLF